MPGLIESDILTLVGGPVDQGYDAARDAPSHWQGAGNLPLTTQTVALSTKLYFFYYVSFK